MKQILVLVMAAMSLVAVADEQIQCDESVMSTVQPFGLKEGIYSPENTDGGFFCAEYRVTNTAYYPCSGNISKLTLSCPSQGKSFDMVCRRGHCETSDGKRELSLMRGNRKIAEYVSNDHETTLNYVQPCN